MDALISCQHTQRNVMVKNGELLGNDLLFETEPARNADEIALGEEADRKSPCRARCGGR